MSSLVANYGICIIGWVAKNDVKFGLSDRNENRKCADEMSLSREHSGGDRRVVIEDIPQKPAVEAPKKVFASIKLTEWINFCLMICSIFEACCFSGSTKIRRPFRPECHFKLKLYKLVIVEEPKATDSVCHAIPKTEFFRDKYFCHQSPDKACLSLLMNVSSKKVSN